MTDIATNGQWACCRSCQFAGDMILLAASAWKLEIRDVVKRLGEQGACHLAYCSDDTVDTYTNIFANPHKKITTFWKTAQKYHIVPATPKLRWLQTLYGVNLPGQEWLARAGQFIGSCTRDEYNEVVRLGSDTTSETKQRSGEGVRLRTVLSKEWEDLLVVPFWDMPGRMSAMLVIGRDGKPERDIVFKKMFREVNEVGLAMLPSLLRGKHPAFGHTKFLFTDIAAAMRLHVKHSREHMDVLPLAASFEDLRYPGANVWNTFSHKNIICWGTDRVSTIKQARLSSGCVSLFEVPADPFATYFKNGSAVDWLNRIKASTVPWVTALQDHIIDKSDESVSDVLARVGLTGRELSTFVETCPTMLRDRLRDITSSQQFESRVNFQNEWICERADGWYVERTNERICSAVVRIEQAVTGVSETHYKGYIRFRGTAYPFTAPSSVMEKGLLDWAQKYLRDVCRAGICEYSVNWNRFAMQLAITFFSPQPVIGVSGTGWDQYNRHFSFPQFTLRIGGEISTDVVNVDDGAVVPAARISPPMFLLPTQLAKLNKQHAESDIFWSTTAAIVANIVAPAVNKNQMPILLCGAGAVGVGYDTAAKHGCVEITDFNRSQYPRRLPVPAWTQNWPILVRPQVPPQNYDWMDDVNAKHYILNVPLIPSYIQLIRGNANVIRYHRNIGSLQLMRDVADKVIANYLTYACQHKLLAYDHRNDLAMEVLHDMTKWFSSIGGVANTVRNAYSLLHTPGRYPCSKYFCELVFTLHQLGKLKFGQFGFWNNAVAPGVTELPNNEGMWISQTRLCNAVSGDCGLSPDVLLITNDLDNQGVLKGETPHFGDIGWVVDTDWWFAQFATWRSDVSCNNGSGSSSAGGSLA